ncbi:MAG: divergent polysaccharide deacetylase family protein [Alphaproteobacteria bacterium]|nr:divergent polysaccharide deacetylase family protein [Alphaproteobacteria bacterium]
MAVKKRTSRMSKAAIIWATVASLLLLANIAMMIGILYGHDHAQLARDASKRIEFDLEYDSAGNAQLNNLQGNPLDLKTAEAMAVLAQSNQSKDDSIPEVTPQPSEEDTLPADFTPVELPTVAPLPEQEVALTPDVTAPPPAEIPSETNANAAPASNAAPTVALAPVETQTTQGIMPTIAADGTKPWQYFAKQDYAKDSEKPRIAVVISGLGLAAISTQDAIALPPEVTLSFSPYGRDTTQTMASKAREAGHEIMLDLPMQTERFPAVDPGPYGILQDLPAQDNISRLNSIFTKARGYIGLLSTLRETISTTPDIIVPLIETIEQRGLMFIAGHTQPPAGMFRVQRTAQTPVLMTDIVLDDRITETHILNQLARAEDHARTQGHALVVGHSYPITVDLLAPWLQSLDTKGFTLVPVSAMGQK